jgi:hypothetical protein
MTGVGQNFSLWGPLCYLRFNGSSLFSVEWQAYGGFLLPSGNPEGIEAISPALRGTSYAGLPVNHVINSEGVASHDS